MNKEELRAKRAAIRKEIKERMQQDLEDCKEEIKRRIKREDLSVEEKREKYRREAHAEKVRLVALAKQEFMARKRMLGEADEEGEYGEGYGEIDGVGAIEERGVDEFGQPAARPPDPEWHDEEDLQLADDDGILQPIDAVDPGDAFILEDDTEDREVLRQLQSPIGEHDALPPEAERFAVEPGVGPGFEPDDVEAPNLFYYIYNLIFHPIHTLDEFDEYISFPSGLRNVAIFYLLSLLPIVAFILLAQAIGEYTSGGLVGAMIGSQTGVMMVVGKTVLDLFLYSFSIAIVNYLFTNEANLITLTTYFAFVEAVTRVIIYTLVILAILAAVIAPPSLAVVGLLLLAFLFWTIALNIIVLMSAYGYGVFSAFLLAIGAYIARRLIFIFISGLLGSSL